MAREDPVVDSANRAPNRPGEKRTRSQELRNVRSVPHQGFELWLPDNGVQQRGRDPAQQGAASAPKIRNDADGNDFQRRVFPIFKCCEPRQDFGGRTVDGEHQTGVNDVAVGILDQRNHPNNQKPPAS